MSIPGNKLNKTESSRLNGAKSHGPVTPEGKQRSSLNAVRHGLLAKSVCLTNEDTEKFKELLQDYLDRFQPIDKVELRLVEQIASASFRLERFASTETSLFDLEMNKQTSQTENQFQKIDPWPASPWPSSPSPTTPRRSSFTFAIKPPSPASSTAL